MRTGTRAARVAAVARLTVAEDGDVYVLGRSDLGIYVAVPEPGAVIVRRLQSGASLVDATASASQVAGAAVDGEQFLVGLAEVGLLDPGPALAAMGRRRDGFRLAWLEAVPRPLARLLFGRVAWSFYATAALATMLLLTLRTDLRPTFDDAWFIADPVRSVVAMTPIALLIVGGHEAWHCLAARALGIGATLRVSRRGIYLVFETELPDLVTLPRRQRYSPLLAGVAFDVTVLATALVLRVTYLDGTVALPAGLDRFLAALVYTQVLAVIWQLSAVALRSDAYAVLANALRCHNLYRATWLVTKARLWRLSRPEQAELDDIGPRDTRTASWFGAVYLAGLAGMWWAFINLALPFLLSMGGFVVDNLVTLDATTVAFWESAAVLAYLVVAYGAPFYLIGRERVRNLPRRRV